MIQTPDKRGWPRHLVGKRTRGALERTIRAKSTAKARPGIARRRQAKAFAGEAQLLPTAGRVRFSRAHAHARCRQAGGQREAFPPDFLIGAHAAVTGRLLTGDPRRVTTYFPTRPCSHPTATPDESWQRALRGRLTRVPVCARVPLLARPKRTLPGTEDALGGDAPAVSLQRRDFGLICVAMPTRARGFRAGGFFSLAIRHGKPTRQPSSHARAEALPPPAAPASRREGQPRGRRA